MRCPHTMCSRSNLVCTHRKLWYHYWVACMENKNFANLRNSQDLLCRYKWQDKHIWSKCKFITDTVEAEEMSMTTLMQLVEELPRLSLAERTPWLLASRLDPTEWRVNRFSTDHPSEFRTHASALVQQGFAVHAWSTRRWCIWWWRSQHMRRRERQIRDLDLI